MAASNFASYNKYDIAFKYDRSREEVTCIQDAKDENRWYYISKKPKLAENQDGDPMITFVSYKKNPLAGIKNNGGILQCTINLTVPDDAIPNLKKELSKALGVQDNKIELYPLNIKKAKIMVYDTLGQERFRSLTPNYFKTVNGVLLVYNISLLEIVSVLKLEIIVKINKSI